jgi:hypothetical protein
MPAKKIQPDAELPKLAAPAMRALKSVGLTDLTKLSRASEAEVAALHGMGPNAMKTIKAAMKARGLAFAKDGKRS